MSIVEKSLSKLREARPEKGAPATDAPAAAPGDSGKAHGRDAPGVRLADVTGAHHLTVDLDALLKRGMLPDAESQPVVDDQLRRIKLPLLEVAVGRRSHESARGRLIMVTSSLPGEGKTFCSLNLALSLAKDKDMSVLLVDGDVRKADITHAFGAEALPGLTDVVGGSPSAFKDVVLRTSIPQLYFVPAGRMVDDLPELWASQRMETMMHWLAGLDGRCIVVFDSSPVLLTSETHVLSRQVGQVAFVVRADFTARNEVVEALALLDSGPVKSCVLNQTRETVAEYYYGRYPYGGRETKDPKIS